MKTVRIFQKLEKFLCGGKNLFKVMIIDDEAIIRAGLRHSVNWEELGFEIFDEAKNGFEAIEKLTLNSVDLVITDIRMPKMNGIDLLRSIKENNFSQCVIFLSGFSEFTYAQQGLALGVFDYILKPMDPVKIIEVLKRAHKFLSSKKNEEELKKTLNEKLEMNKTISREKILYDMLLGRELPLPAIADVLFEYEIDLDLYVTQLAVLEIDDFDINAEEWIKSGKDLELFEKIKGISMDIINKNGAIKGIIVDGEIGSLSIVLQPVSIADHIIFDNTTMDVMNRILLGINNELEVQLTIGIGRVYESLDEVSCSFRDAKNALRHKYSLGSNKIIHAQQIEPCSNKQFSNSIEREKLLLSYIILGDDRAYTVVEDIFNIIYNSGENSVFSVGTVLNKIMAGLARSIKEEYSFLNIIFDTEKLANVDFCSYSDVSSTRQYFAYLITELLSLIREYKLNQRDNIISKACEYVLNNVEDDITLKSVSEHLCISKNYFCSLFKQETGENFLEYVTRVKMERAKKLLKMGTFKAYEISYMLGYQETGYFSRIFKKYSGYSPTEYRKNIK